MAVKWDSRAALGIISTQDAGFTCVAIKTGNSRSRCLTALSQEKRARILSNIDNRLKAAPVNRKKEMTVLEKIAEDSFCQNHNTPKHKANALLEWQQALTAERAALAIKRKLQSEGIDDSDNSSMDDSDSENELDDSHSPDDDDTTNTSLSTIINFDPESEELHEIRELRDRLAQVTLEAEELRQQIQRTTPELDDLRQQLMRATPEAEANGLHEQLGRATAENRRLGQRLDAVRRISDSRNAEPEVDEIQSEPLGVQSE